MPLGSLGYANLCPEYRVGGDRQPHQGAEAESQQLNQLKIGFESRSPACDPLQSGAPHVGEPTLLPSAPLTPALTTRGRERKRTRRLTRIAPGSSRNMRRRRRWWWLATAAASGHRGPAIALRRRFGFSEDLRSPGPVPWLALQPSADNSHGARPLPDASTPLPPSCDWLEDAELERPVFHWTARRS